ncbi:DUF2057 domain-containing protein [Vibrio vulnificus]|nr:DUF2057 domain-containing protein [Vibrio vulnificus]EIZ4666189.1 DUF2057 domain-containing protein [Vibrio vulnificus]
MYIRMASLAFGLMLSFTSNAAVLTSEQGVSVLFINGQQAESKIGENQIAPGKNQILVRMDKKVGRGSSAEVFTSDPYVLEFSIESEANVKLYHPKARSHQEAEAAFSKREPEWLIKQSGESIPYTIEKLQGREGFLPYGDLEGLLAKHNEQAGMTVIDKIQQSEVASNTNTSANVKHGSALTQLQHWYKQASTEERKAFRKWMVDQE